MRLVGVVSKNSVAGKILAGRRNLFSVVYRAESMIQLFTTSCHVKFLSLYLWKHNPVLKHKALSPSEAVLVLPAMAVN